MADLTQKQYLDLAGLKIYDEKIKAYVDATDATLDAAIKGVNGNLTAEIANREAGDQAIHDIIGDWRSYDSELTLTEAIDALAGDDGILKGMQADIDAVDAKVGDIERLGELTNVVDAIMMISDAIGNPNDLAKDTITESINANADAIAALTNGESGVLASAKAYTDEKVKAVNDVIGDISAFGDSETVASLLTDTGEQLENLDTAIANEKTRAEAAEKAINDAIGAWNPEDFGGNTITQTIALLGDTFTVDGEFVSMADVVRLIDNEEARATAAEEALGDRIDAHVAAVDGKVATLVGEDEGKSVRTIANEELAAQLLSGEADADFKTLQELAAWLEAHPESVAEMNADIAANAQDIADLKAAVGEGGSVDAQIDAKIAELDSDATKTAAADGLALEVHIVDGKLTGINGSIAANTYDAYGAAAAAQTAAAEDATTKANAAETNAKTYADTVYGAMASIPNSEIEALFA